MGVLGKAIMMVESDGERLAEDGYRKGECHNDVGARSSTRDLECRG